MRPVGNFNGEHLLPANAFLYLSEAPWLVGVTYDGIELAIEEKPAPETENLVWRVDVSGLPQDTALPFEILEATADDQRSTEIIVRRTLTPDDVNPTFNTSVSEEFIRGDLVAMRPDGYCSWTLIFKMVQVFDEEGLATAQLYRVVENERILLQHGWAEPETYFFEYHFNVEGWSHPA